MDIHLDLIDFMMLRDKVDNVDRQFERMKKEKVIIPKYRGKRFGEEDVVELGEIFKSTLGAISSATKKLSMGKTQLSLGGEPLNMNFVGEIVGVSHDASKIFLTIQPKGKEKKNGGQKE